MKKKKLQLLGMTVLFLLLIGAYFGLRAYKEGQERAKANETVGAIPLVEEEFTEVLSFSYDLNGETYAFVKQDETWYYEADRDMKLEQTTIRRMLVSLAPLSASAKLEKPMGLAEYGLDAPKQTIHMKTTKGEYTFLIGDQNNLTGEVYLKKDGEDTIYLVDAAVGTACSSAPEDMRVTEEETAEGSL